MSRIDFESPWFLLVLLALPALLVVLRFTLVDSPRAQLALSTATRCIILALLALALGSLLWVSRSQKLSLLLLGDLSDSVADSAPAQLSNQWSKVAASSSSQARAGLNTFAATNDA